jgi:hypothetical protein
MVSSVADMKDPSSGWALVLEKLGETKRQIEIAYVSLLPLLTIGLASEEALQVPCGARSSVI